MDGLTITEPTRNRPELPLWKLIKYARDLDLSEIEKTMPEDSTAKKQLEAELGTNCCTLGGARCLYTAGLVSPVQSIVQTGF